MAINNYGAEHLVNVYFFSQMKAIRDIMLKGHKQAFLWLDEWHGKRTFIQRNNVNLHNNFQDYCAKINHFLKVLKLANFKSVNVY